MNWSVLLLAAVTVERLAELWLARRNTRALTLRGAFEVAPGHYPLIIIMHALWLVGLWVIARDRPVQLPWAAIFGFLQILRFWTLSAIGRRWTTRIIILPGEQLVSTGPYRFLRHPNYIVVVGEIAVLPLSLGLPIYALAFSIANAIVLTIRIKAENAALSRPHTELA
ncbi:isoprenylcysteine carboxyl methyltransferase family protein [Rhizobium sp. RAF56]|uniref:isoprenylcysteine carboxyl methyltransferase family protein n=1 Tax=Rhizobium sp. RAF56 TaxID=3233062 RepID=UPI003F96CD8E